jgi:hypothetical protein
VDRQAVPMFCPEFRTVSLLTGALLGDWVHESTN